MISLMQFNFTLRNLHHLILILLNNYWSPFLHKKLLLHLYLVDFFHINWFLYYSLHWILHHLLHNSFYHLINRYDFGDFDYFLEGSLLIWIVKKFSLRKFHSTFSHIFVISTSFDFSSRRLII